MLRIMIDGDWVMYTAGFAAQHTEYVAYGRDDDGTRCPFGFFDSKRDMNEYFKKVPDAEPEVFSRTYTDPLDHALHSAKKMVQSQVEKIIERFDPDDVEITVYLDGEGNFRNDIATIRPYKGNRVNAPKPILYPEIRQYLLYSYQTDVSNGCESDDRMAMMQGSDSIIVGIDKDLLQVPGWHLNPNKGFKKVSKAEGQGRLYRQAVMGDAVDNIAGAHKVGKVAASKIITPGMTELEMWEATVGAYEQSIEKYPDLDLYGGLSAEEAALENMRLVYLQRKPDEVWFPPYEE